MEYRTLENTDSACIYEAFTQAFSDYQVSVDMPFKSFETMLKRNGFMSAVSVGAFADRTLVGFILNGVREWDNKKTIYDLGTGVIPDFRRTGIMEGLLNLVRTICIENKISVYQLEVIQDNEKALTLYKKQGFRINRILNCYQLTDKIKEPGVYKVWKLEHPEKLQDDQWTVVKDFWTYPPSWQNAKDAVCAIAKSFSYTIVKFDGNLIGYGIVAVSYTHLRCSILVQNPYFAEVARRRTLKNALPPGSRRIGKAGTLTCRGGTSSLTGLLQFSHS